MEFFLHLFFNNHAIIPVWLDLAAVVVGAISGALVGTSKKLDLIGVIACAILTGLGGGLIRDITMQVRDVYFLNSIYAIPSTLITGFLVFYFHGFLDKIPHVMEWSDIISVALFVVVGAEKAIQYGLFPMSVVFMGAITGVGGGMLRDVFIGETPKIFVRSNYYAICAVAGSIIFDIMVQFLQLPSHYAVLPTVLTTVGLRRLSLHYGWMSPAGVDYSQKIIHKAHTFKKIKKRKK